MREACIILPRLDNNGADLGAVHADFRAALCLAFGGATIAPVFGIWRDEKSGEVFEDESLEYRIAADWNPAERETLESLANVYGLKAGQLAVYVKHANGAVSIIEPAAPVEVEARPVTAAQRRAAEFARDLERGAGRAAKLAQVA